MNYDCRITYGIFFASSTRWERWAYGQNLILYSVTFPFANGGHVDPENSINNKFKKINNINNIIKY